MPPVTPARAAAREATAAARSLLPASLVARAVRYAHRKRGVHVVTDIADLAEHFAAAHVAFARSPIEGREVLRTFELAPPQDLPRDPFSAEYRERQFQLYRTISARAGYALENEASVFDVENAATNPFPYSSGSADVVGDHLAAVGFLLKSLQLPTGASVVEFGPGWGTTTEIFLALGYEVTVVEIEARFCELIARRCERFGDRLKVVNADMLSFAAQFHPDDEPFDAAVFFESFHHCHDHLALLEHLHDVVGPTGRLAFAAEPIGELPMPWGIRLDGESLFSMHTHGWLELGFERRYFGAALARCRWAGTRYASLGVSHYNDVLVARSVNQG